MHLKTVLLLTVLCCTAVLAAACSKGGLPEAGPLTMPDYNLELRGVAACFDNGAVVLFSDEHGGILLDGSMNFSGLQTGDDLTVYTDGIMESFPPRAIVKEMRFHAHGTCGDLPADGMEQFLSLGYEMAGYDPAVPAYRSISMEEAAERFKTGGDYLILDVRRGDEFAEGHIPGAVNLANEDIQQGITEGLPDKDQLIYVYCRSGRRSKQAAEKLASLGYTNIIEFGGILDWPGSMEVPAN